MLLAPDYRWEASSKQRTLPMLRYSWHQICSAYILIRDAVLRWLDHGLAIEVNLLSVSST